jgi:hypothetical protein
MVRVKFSLLNLAIMYRYINGWAEGLSSGVFNKAATGKYPNLKI